MLPQRVARLDLTTRQADIQNVPDEVTRKLLGGRGVNMYLLYRHVTPQTTPLSPANPLIIGPGLLTGLKGISAARANISAKSPETGLLGDANIGGYFGAHMKRTGIDYLVVTGQAETPVYLHVTPDGISIEDASDLWGGSTTDTNATLDERHGPQSQAISIGQAGENLVRFACIINRKKNAAARTGLGCLMGSKRLKAVVVEGDADIKPHDPKAFSALIKGLQAKLNEERLVKMLKDLGSPYLYLLVNRRIKMGRAYNGLSAAFNKNEDVSPQILKDKYYQGREGCFSCPVGCQHRYKVDKIESEGPEYTTFASFGPMLGIGKLAPVLKMNELLNRYGLDASSTANIIAWAIELYQDGVINRDTTGGLELKWGDGETVIELIHHIAHRHGFGSILADGAKEAVETLGQETAKRMMWTKYLPQSDPVDLRYFPAYALGNAVASRGSDHLRARPTWEAFNLPEEELTALYGGRVASDPKSYTGKGRVIWWREIYLSLFDALGTCKQIALACQPGVFDYAFFSKLIASTTGIEITPDEVFDVGRRITTLERMFLTREGITRKDDLPPQRYFEPFVWKEGLKPDQARTMLDRDSFEGMLDEYYDLHGWDSQGRPTDETIASLGLTK